MTELDKLFKIPAFGQQIGRGQSFSIKWRIKFTQEIADKLTQLKHKYPELLIHKSEAKQSIVFGGTFSSSSNFMYEAKLVMGRR